MSRIENIRRIVKPKEKKGDSPPTITRQFWLAVLIIAPAFILIIIMLSIQNATIGSIIQRIPENVDQTDAATLESLNDFFDRTERSNQTLFNILLPVFSAWVGVVIAFYFGSEQTRRAQDTLEKALSPEEKLSGIKIKQTLDDNPSAKSLKIVKMKQPIKEIKDSFGDLSNVLVVDDNQKPLGILYKQEFSETFKDNLESPEPLSNLISNIKQDRITKGPWDKDKGIKNFAILSLNDDLASAKEKMHAIADNVAVRGIVVDVNGKAIGIVSFDMLAAYIK